MKIKTLVQRASLVSWTASTLFITGCAYSRHVDGRVIDSQNSPVSGATVLMATYRECGRPGDIAREFDRVVGTTTDKGGNFSITSRGAPRFLSFCVNGGVKLVSASLFVCKSGEWVARRDRPSEELVSGDLIFENPNKLSDGVPFEFKSFPAKIKGTCVRGPN